MLHPPYSKNKIAFLVIFVILGLITLRLISSYLDIIALAMVIVIILRPLYVWFLQKFAGRVGAALTMTLLVFFLVTIIPLFFSWEVISSQLAVFLVTFQDPQAIPNLLDTINSTIENTVGLDLPNNTALQEQLQQVLVRVANWVADLAIGFGSQVADWVSRLIIFLGVLVSILPNYDQMIARIRKLSPLNDELDDIFLQKIKLTVRAMFFGIFVIAVAQGLACGIFFWLTGVPYAPIWTLLAVIASLFPLGASLVVIPVGLVQLFTGHYIAGLVILLGYFLLVSNIDTLLRPYLVPKEADMNFVMVLVSALGGLELFGFFGVVYGPVLMVIFLTALSVYEGYINHSSETTLDEPDPIHDSG
jgi:predicted PurR-regulated permease PerM